MPTLTVFAGPNGAGKSTLTALTEFDGRERLLDPDAIAKQLNPANPLAAAIAAGRIVIERTRNYLQAGDSFAIETTLSSRNNIELMREAKERTFAVHLAFVGLENPTRCMQRIKERVTRGGHFVPDQDVIRRYSRTMANALVAFQIADTAAIYDNSEAGHRVILIARGGKIAWRAERIPQWAEPLASS